jgi:hypothetical protein
MKTRNDRVRWMVARFAMWGEGARVGFGFDCPSCPQSSPIWGLELQITYWGAVMAKQWWEPQG